MWKSREQLFPSSNGLHSLASTQWLWPHNCKDYRLIYINYHLIQQYLIVTLLLYHAYFNQQLPHGNIRFGCNVGVFFYSIM